MTKAEALMVAAASAGSSQTDKATGILERIVPRAP
jgi:hypothetical protein